MRVIQQEPSVAVRVRPDGPSPSEQAQAAREKQLGAEITRIAAEMQSLAVRGRLSAAERARMGELRTELQAATRQLRDLHLDRHEPALERAAQAIAEQVAGAGRAATMTTVPPVPPIRPNAGEIPQGAMEISIAFFVTVGAVIILFPLMRALGRILERRSAPPRHDPEVGAQLQRMENAIEAMAIEVERIAESQRFTAKLLAEREKAAQLHP